MRTLRQLAVAVLAATFAAAAAPAPQESIPRAERPGVAILDIPVAQGAYYGWYGWYGNHANERRMADVLRDLLTTELVEHGTGKIRMVERSRLDSIRKEQALGLGGEVDSDTAANVGKLLGARYIITGKISRFAQKKSSFSGGWGAGVAAKKLTGSSTAGAAASSTRVGTVSFEGRLDLRVIDVETGEIVAAASEEATTKNTSVKVAGTGNDIQYDDSMVNDVFEPIVKQIAPKLVSKLLEAHKNAPPPAPKPVVPVVAATDSPAKVVEKYEIAMRKPRNTGDASVMANLIYKDQTGTTYANSLLQDSTQIDALLNWINLHGDVGDIVGINETISGDTATVIVNYQYGGNQYDLAKENAEWKIVIRDTSEDDWD